MELVIYIFFASLLLLFAYIVFRRVVRRDYRDQSRLGTLSSIARLLVFLGYFAFPYLFNPLEWAWFWMKFESTPPILQIAGIVLIGLGMVVAFGTMAWFGIGKAFGLKVEAITRQGPYKVSRNPQILGGYLLTAGVFCQRPTFAMLAWVLMYALIAHLMVITEEDHLSRVFGRPYATYCSEVPRYLLRSRK